MTARASRAWSGLASKTLRPAPAWIAMMPMLCATMSCSSRAIRSRSARTVWAAAWARTQLGPGLCLPDRMSDKPGNDHDKGVLRRANGTGRQLIRGTF